MQIVSDLFIYFFLSRFFSAREMKNKNAIK